MNDPSVTFPDGAAGTLEEIASIPHCGQVATGRKGPPCSSENDASDGPVTINGLAQGGDLVAVCEVGQGIQSLGSAERPDGDRPATRVTVHVLLDQSCHHMSRHYKKPRSFSGPGLARARRNFLALEKGLVQDGQRGRFISIGTKFEGWLTTRSLVRAGRLEFTSIPPQKANEVRACWRLRSLSFIF
jgi:hypothetical protein